MSRIVLNRVMVTGMGVFTPLAQNCAALRDALFEGQDSILPVKNFSVSGFQSALASTFTEVPDVGLSSDELSWMDRATIFAVAALREAIAQANLTEGEICGERMGVCLGSSHSGLIETENVALAAFHGKLDTLDPRKICATLVSHCTSVVKRMVGACGRIITISSACASSNTAIGMGADLIRKGEADMVIAGGADTVSLSVMAGFNALHALSPTKTAPFSKPFGLNIGEGAGIVILESEASASRREVVPRAEILGYGLSGDAYHATAPDLHGRGAEQAMREALSIANCTPRSIDYVNAHGTGTAANDSAESQAMFRVFGSGTPVSSMKSFFGHTLGASGVLELIGTLLMAERGFAPHGLRLTEVRSGCAKLDYITDAPRPGNFKTVMVNNFGFGGNNSSLVACLPGASCHYKENVARLGVMVSGIGVVSAAGIGFPAFSHAVAQGVSLAERDQQLASAPPSHFTKDTLKPFARASRSAKWGIQSLEMALGDTAALYDHNPRSGLIYGALFGAQKPTEKFMESVFFGDPALANAHYFPMTTLNANGGVVSLAFGVTGYTTTVCGGASALSYALDLVADGKQDRVAAVAADEATSHLLSIYHRSGVLGGEGSPNSIGEGGCAMTLEHGQNQSSTTPLAKISGWAHFQDPIDRGVKPDGDALVRAITSALARAELNRECIDGMVLLTCGPVPISTSVQRALERTFGARLPKRIADPISVVGYGPSVAPLWTVAAGISAMQRLDSLNHVLALGVDLIGDAYAIVIGRVRERLE